MTSNPGSAMPAGKLYVCATPIGNLQDVTLRLLDILKEVDLIAAEDTRITRKLLSRYDLHTALTSCHQRTPPAKIAAIVGRLQEGESVALVCNAGTPSISDPGNALVDACIAAEITVVGIPGPCAAITALAISGMPSQRFYFQGFLPRRDADRRRVLQDLAGREETVVVYEAPGRVGTTLQELSVAFGQRYCAVARELTKLHEEVTRGDLPELARRDWTDVRGEVTIVIQGSERLEESPENVTDDELASALRDELASGKSRRDAAESVRSRFGVSRQRLYLLLDR